MNSYSRLNAGGILLPSLIEFYQWLITDLSHVLTKEDAEKMSISEAVSMAAEKYSSDIEAHYIKLYEDVQGILKGIFPHFKFILLYAEHYNNYLKVIDFSIGAGACANFQRKNDVPQINGETPVFRFLPGETADEKEDQRDYLLLVIEDIVNPMMINV